jgi:hypothetical protein
VPGSTPIQLFRPEEWSAAAGTAVHLTGVAGERKEGFTNEDVSSGATGALLLSANDSEVTPGSGEEFGRAVGTAFGVNCMGSIESDLLREATRR